MASGYGWIPRITYEYVISLNVVMDETARMNVTKGIQHLIYEDLGLSHSEWLDGVLAFQVSFLG